MKQLSSYSVNRVYVAASSSELLRAEEWMDRLRHSMYSVTSKWVESIREVGIANPKDAALEDRTRWSLDCLEGVDAAGVLWLLAPEVGSGKGAFFELGYSFAQGKYIIVSGPGSKSSIFSALANEEHESDRDAFLSLMSLRHTVEQARRA